MNSISNIPAASHTARTAPSPAQPLPVRAAEVAAPRAEADRVDLSEEARLLDALRERADIRPEVVARVKAEIEAGRYLTDERLDAALDAMIDDATA